MAKGLYKPLHPEKYLGDPRKIRFLSSWELRAMQLFDANPNVIAWGSEEFKITYYHPIKKKVSSYIPDFLIKYKKADGTVVTEVVEIKPAKETFINIPGRKKISIYDRAQLVVNHAKWEAAKVFCAKHKIGFRILTENELFRQKK